jgi:hypothetical protein
MTMTTPRGQRGLVWGLRALGVLDLLALTVVVMPWAWLAAAHAAAGLGEMPQAPVVGYLARSASVLYALHGAAVLFLSSDVVRYRPLIRFWALAALAHGAIMFGIDRTEGMPRLWTLLEGPCFAATGALVLLLLAGTPVKEQ